MPQHQPGYNPHNVARAVRNVRIVAPGKIHATPKQQRIADEGREMRKVGGRVSTETYSEFKQRQQAARDTLAGKRDLPTLERPKATCKPRPRNSRGDGTGRPFVPHCGKGK